MPLPQLFWNVVEWHQKFKCIHLNIKYIVFGLYSIENGTKSICKSLRSVFIYILTQRPNRSYNWWDFDWCSWFTHGWRTRQVGTMSWEVHLTVLQTHNPLKVVCCMFTMSPFPVIWVKILSHSLTRSGLLSMQLSAWYSSGCLVCGSEQYDDIIMCCTILEMLLHIWHKYSKHIWAFLCVWVTSSSFTGSQMMNIHQPNHLTHSNHAEACRYSTFMN